MIGVTSSGLADSDSLGHHIEPIEMEDDRRGDVSVLARKVMKSEPPLNMGYCNFKNMSIWIPPEGLQRSVVLPQSVGER